MFTIPSIGILEISPIYKFIVLLYVFLFLTVIFVNIIFSIITLITNRWQRKNSLQIDLRIHISDKRKQFRQPILRSVSVTMLAILSVFFTAFVMLNATEQVLFIDIPYIETLREYKHSAQLSSLISKNTPPTAYLHRLINDIPRHLTLPSIKSTIELPPELSNGNIFYVRGNKGHTVKRPQSNTLIIYFDENWRTTTDLNKLKIDELLFVLSYDYNYIFKIDQVLINNPENLISKPGNVLEPHLLIVGEQGNSIVIVSATLINSVHR